MNSINYQTGFAVNKQPQHIVDCICNVAGWWARYVEGNSTTIDDIFTVRFGKTSGTFKVTELQPLKKMRWLVTNSYLPLFKNISQWNGTELLWEISNDNIISRLTMTHIGLTPEIECYADCKKGWHFYINESLFKLITKGGGMPGTGIFAHISNTARRYEGILYSRHDPLPDLTGEHILIDVMKTKGEQVTAVYAIEKLNKENFIADNLKGEYYMIVENTPLYNDATPLEDIELITGTFLTEGLK